MSVIPPYHPLQIVRMSPTIGALLVMLTACSMVAGQDDPASFLRSERGLRKISGGNVWLVSSEFRLQRVLSELEPLQRRIMGLQQNLEQAVGQNRALWETSRQRIESLRRALAEAETDDDKSRKIEQQIRELETQAVPPCELFAVPDIRRALIELTNLRLQLLLSVIEIRRLHGELTETYAQLAADEAVRTALRRLGDDHRIGPLRQGYDSQLKRLERFEQLVATDWLPVYRQSERIRFGGLIEDRVPVTFSWQESYEPTVLAASMVEAAGVPIPDDASTVPLTLAGRRLTARRIQITSMRFGTARLTDVPVLVLPADAEDLGAWIGPEGFGQYRVEIEPERLRMMIYREGKVKGESERGK